MCEGRLTSARTVTAATTPSERRRLRDRTPLPQESPLPSVMGTTAEDDCSAPRRKAADAAANRNNAVTGSVAAEVQRAVDFDRIRQQKSNGMRESEQPWGRCARTLAHVVAITVVVALMICAIGGFVLLVFQSVLNLQDHWDVYRIGARNAMKGAEKLATRLTGGLPKALADELASTAISHLEEVVSFVVSDLVTDLWHSLLEFLMMALFITFWLADPMPVGSEIEELFKRYIILKGMACFGYGVCVGILLWVLNIDLASVFALAASLLSFVPEVGPFVALILPAPIIMFDSRLESPMTTLLTASFAQMALKFVFANVVEVKLVEADQLMRMHPVIVLLAVAFFGYIWGPTGMLLSVPLVAYLKVGLLADTVPPRYRDPILVLLEGDRRAPEKHARKRQLEEEREAALAAAAAATGHRRRHSFSSSLPESDADSRCRSPPSTPRSSTEPSTASPSPEPRRLASSSSIEMTSATSSRVTPRTWPDSNANLVTTSSTVEAQGGLGLDVP
eukprot:TRINITY_DN21181_c0_g1_i2.p1 TRINITY_DN21181_c0_g1~~TRINITY_DN21181_c0_g1_i2.p1  ORF type:complete len:507 (+),score=64.86 TRINITY_DN21181_c0_g1_i2:204-1724(+)